MTKAIVEIIQGDKRFAVINTPSLSKLSALSVLQDNHEKSGKDWKIS